MMLVIRPPGRRTSSPLGTGLGLLRAAVFLVGAALGALAILALSWAIGAVMNLQAVIGLAVILTISFALAARDTGIVLFRLPQRRGQVKRETMLNHPFGGLLIHGFALGTAFYTFVPISLPYLIFLLPVLISIEVSTLAGIAVAFALGRSLAVFARMFFRTIDADALGQTLMTRGLPVARTISAVTLALWAGLTLQRLVQIAAS